jgi:hypothetical protein
MHGIGRPFKRGRMRFRMRCSRLPRVATIHDEPVRAKAALVEYATPFDVCLSRLATGSRIVQERLILAG